MGRSTVGEREGERETEYERWVVGERESERETGYERWVEGERESERETGYERWVEGERGSERETEYEKCADGRVVKEERELKGERAREKPSMKDGQMGEWRRRGRTKCMGRSGERERETEYEIWPEGREREN
ncbi:octapeptide-repeat protein T2-like [Pleurodeles waltl]|uniref:octapeptide-repeat protein T2-like n=1 Tax=Pleurodeles waltl TaxID=8319 RepID=UPI0037098B40